jgi:hypothetical protein
MKKLLLVHRHKFGTSTAFCKAKDFTREDVSQEEAIKLAKLCGLDFEPDEGEELEILDADQMDVPTITKDMLK